MRDADRDLLIAIAQVMAAALDEKTMPDEATRKRWVDYLNKVIAAAGGDPFPDEIS